MSDFTVEPTSKTMNLLLRILEKVIETAIEEGIKESFRMKTPEYQLKSLELQASIKEKKLEEAKEKLNKKTGFVSYKKLKEAGVKVQPIELKISSPEQMKELNEYCKKEGILITGITNLKESGIGKENQVIDIYARPEDLPQLKNLAELVAEKSKQSEIDKSINEETLKNDVNSMKKVSALKEQKELSESKISELEAKIEELEAKLETKEKEEKETNDSRDTEKEEKIEEKDEEREGDDSSKKHNERSDNDESLSKNSDKTKVQNSKEKSKNETSRER